MRKVLPFVLLSALCVGGCRNDEYYRKLRIEKADEHFRKIEERKIRKDKIFSLPDCIETALKNNYDLKVEQLKEQISEERRTAAMLGMLPELNATNDLTSRSNEPGSSSQSLLTGDQSLVSSKSTEKTMNTFKIELAFSAIDFGLAYFNSVQAEDRVQLSKQQLRRTAQNLILDVGRAYFRVAATQYAVETTERLLADCENIDEVLTELTRNRTISPLRALDERKRFIQLRKRLMEYVRSYENSCVELNALMGYHPSEMVKVDVSCLDKINALDVPDIDLLERIALRERPELYQYDMQQHITIVEARKVILMMFPNVRMFVDFNNSTNKFLYNQSWWEIGVRAAYNLLKLPEQIQEYVALDNEIDELDIRTISMTVAVMAQVRIAHSNLAEVRERYMLDKRIYDAYNEHLETSKRNASAIGKISPIEIKRLELETVETAIERANSLGNYYLAYYRLLNTIGIESMDDSKLEAVVRRLEQEAMKEYETIKKAESPEQLKKEEEKSLLKKDAEIKEMKKSEAETETVLPKQSDTMPAAIKNTDDEKMRMESKEIEDELDREEEEVQGKLKELRPDKKSEAVKTE